MGATSQPKGNHSIIMQDGFVPCLFSVTANFPGAKWKLDGSLDNHKIACNHMDRQTFGGLVVIPWAQFDTRDANCGGGFTWDFIEQQMKPWVD